MRSALILAALTAATPAFAQVRVVPDQPASEAAARAGVDVYLINEGGAEAAAHAPARIEVTAADATRVILMPAGSAPATVAARGFARLRYVAEIAPPQGSRGDGYPAAPEAIAAAPAREQEGRAQSSNGASSAFLDRFAPYEPIYGAAGFGDSGAILQFSFAFKPVGGGGLLSGLTFAYTQKMFWAVEVPSGPFRATNYAPEIFLDVPLGERTTLGFGYAHTSNGRGDPVSIDANRLFVRATRRFELGGGWAADLTPQAWVYVGDQGIAPDLDRYWGFASLKASLGQTSGLKLAVTTRGNPGTGKGSAELFASWPLTRAGPFGFYLFGQGFTGYGEALDDFRVKDTHARLGIALTR